MLISLAQIIHKPDKHSGMVFTAGRDIAPGEECCISYFDMTQYTTLRDRRERLQSLFRFKCGCSRCSVEEAEEVGGGTEGTGTVSEGNEVQWDTFPGFE